MHDEMTTWEAYRYAERTFKWKVYRFYRFVWIVAISYLFLAMTFPAAVGSGFVCLGPVSG